MCPVYIYFLFLRQRCIIIVTYNKGLNNKNGGKEMMKKMVADKFEVKGNKLVWSINQKNFVAPILERGWGYYEVGALWFRFKVYIR